MEDSLRNFMIALPLALMAGAAWAQDSATVTDNCANHLNTSRNPTVGAMLNCLAEMQRTIDRLEAAASTPTALSQSDIAAIAQELEDNHLQAIKGDPGEPGRPREEAKVPSGAVIASTLPCEALEDGWKLYYPAAGRFIVGAGAHADASGARNLDVNGEPLHIYQGPDDLAEVTLRRPSAANSEALRTGGAETHTLQPAEMPAHRHTGRTSGTSGTGNTSNAAQLGAGYQSPSFSVDTRAAVRSAPHPIQPHSHDVVVDGSPGLEGQAHNNMPPYIALYFCRKE